MRTDRSFARMLDLNTRTAPDELCFLLRELQTVKSEMAGMERSLEVFPAKIEACRTMITALEAVIARHPVDVDTAKIPAVRRNTPRLLPYGKLTQLIFRVLREQGNLAVSTFTIAVGVSQHAGLKLERKEFIRFNRIVLRQLNHLKKCGNILREDGPEIGTNTEGYWRLPSHDAAF